jgi:DNA mismatch repair ATPase MutS
VQFSLSIAKGLSVSSIVSFSLSLGSFLLTVTTAFLKLVAENIHAHEVVDEGGDDQMRKTIAVLRADNERIRQLEAKNERLELELKEIKNGITKNPLNSRLSISMIYPNNDDIPEQSRLSLGKLEANGESRPNS